MKTVTIKIIELNDRGDMTLEFDPPNLLENVEAKLESATEMSPAEIPRSAVSRLPSERFSVLEGAVPLLMRKVPPPGTARPASRRRPSSAARRSTSSSSRDFPIPASPVTSSTPPVPAGTRSTAVRATASSAARPTITGLRTGVTAPLW